jgi:uncharacterized protein
VDVMLIAAAAMLASALTLYSGFGLGTILLPVFALFVPVPTAVAATGVVHLANNLFKGALLHARADWRTVLRFGLPAVPAAMVGAWVLAELGSGERLLVWNAWGRSFGPSAAGLTVGMVMIVLALLELQPWFARLAAPGWAMPIGGLLTGFIGGLSGQQGALRSVFLLRAGLNAERFIATGVMIAVLIDLSRIATYVAAFSAGTAPRGREWTLVAAGTLAAIAGAWVAIRYMRKVTIGTVRYAVAAMLLLIGAALATGLVGSPG